MAVKAPHFLLAAPNSQKMRANLKGIVDDKALEAIEREIRRNTAQLYRLASEHLVFACAQAANWRQCVSRLYYAAYNASRALRLLDSGQYLQNADDHGNVAELPPDFPERQRFQNRLKTLRQDRNLCDYDHEAAAGDLAFSVGEWTRFTKEFAENTAGFLRHRGVQV